MLSFLCTLAAVHIFKFHIIQIGLLSTECKGQVVIFSRKLCINSSEGRISFKDKAQLVEKVSPNETTENVTFVSCFKWLSSHSQVCDGGRSSPLWTRREHLSVQRKRR